MAVTVWHMSAGLIRDPDNRWGFTCWHAEDAVKAMEAWEANRYVEVARVDTDSLEEAFRLTNTIEEPWMNNPKVTAVLECARSTSPGDIMERDGMLYVVGGRRDYFTDPRLVTRVPVEELPPLVGKYPELDGLIESRLNQEA